MSDLRLHLSEPQVATPVAPALPFGRHLVNEGVIAQADLVHALNLQRHIDAPLGEILVAEGLAEEHDVLHALSIQHNAQQIDLRADPPDPHMAQALPSALCLQHGVVPWMRLGNMLLVATSRPDRFEHLRACVGAAGARMLPVIADEAQIQSTISDLFGQELAQRAASCVPAAESCRSWKTTSQRRWVWAVGLAAAVGVSLIAAPLWTITVAMVLAFVTLMMTTGLKLAAFCAQMSPRLAGRPETFEVTAAPFPMPRVSILVPLLHEKEIAGKLIERLSRLTYPKSLLNVVLVLEACDDITRETLARTDLPPWISVIEVPSADQLTTKPRALNYALNFCTGSIIGVWDAEDAPEPDQIESVVNRFQQAPKNVACLQGVLDYYNPRANWLARCFTIEYATWWRMVLPGVAKLGLVIPLGGTTLFFRRDILERLCGWDAHNVTEDADLGVRLARHGYVTELLPTVTYEEANCHAWPWVRQRSRWLKGFLITWCVHMRTPRQLLRELGFLRFLGVQTVFLATFAQFAGAPLLWSFWITLFGISHPVALTLGTPVALGMAGAFLLAEVINLSISLVAVSGREHRHLMLYVLTMPFYFMLGALAAYKALYEMVRRPFFWDKTQHGVTQETD
ncbi:glycosyl transferase [Sulfitobacter sp. SK012]|uniref:glycosyltransferase family 2 protein n=1 Tax=Sulfitobacter sp. SK012 TaxID=1389005 RepID=UPI000E0B73A1|nr:glycosyltransferase family 2 protein [Sulfitobacter sp. SK012]AXI47357.1 glycosyl transferase [Sulfitobacter sp. SK012]